MHTSVAWQDTMYVFGGLAPTMQPKADLFVLNLQEWTWRHLGQVTVEGQPVKASGHSAGVYEGKMLVFGGTDMETAVYNSLFVYDFAGHWGKAADSLRPRFGGGMAVDETVRLVGGIDLLSKEMCQTVDTANLQSIEWLQP